MKRRVIDTAEVFVLSFFVSLIKIVSYILLTLVVLFALFIIYSSNMQTVRGEELIGTYHSPNGTYILTTYLNNAKDWTVDFAVLGRVKNTKTNLSKNIYYKYHCNIAKVQWLDDTTVVINDVIINVTKDTYDNSDYDPRYLAFSLNP